MQCTGECCILADFAEAAACPRGISLERHPCMMARPTRPPFYVSTACSLQCAKTPCIQSTCLWHRSIHQAEPVNTIFSIRACPVASASRHTEPCPLCKLVHFVCEFVLTTDYSERRSLCAVALCSARLQLNASAASTPGAVSYTHLTLPTILLV